MSIENIVGHASIDPRRDHSLAKDRQHRLLGDAAEYRGGDHDSTLMNNLPTDGTGTETGYRIGKLIPRALGILAVLFSTGCNPDMTISTNSSSNVEPTPISAPRMQPMIDNGAGTDMITDPMVPIITYNP